MVGGFKPTPLKNDGVKVSWDDNIPNIWKVIKHVPNSKPPIRYFFESTDICLNDIIKIGMD